MCVDAVAQLLGVIYAKQDSLLYHPSAPGLPRKPADNPRSLRSPSEWNIPYQDVYIPAADGVVIHAWLLHAQSSPESSPTVVFFHGNAGSACVPLFFLSLLTTVFSVHRLFPS